MVLWHWLAGLCMLIIACPQAQGSSCDDSPLIMTSTSTSRDLNQALSAWLELGCDGKVIFRNAATYKLSNQRMDKPHQTIVLDASQAMGTDQEPGVILLSGINERHFLIDCKECELKATGLQFQGGQAGTGGSILLGAKGGSGNFHACNFVKNAAWNGLSPETSNRAGGGAIYMSSAENDVSIRDCFFQGNMGLVTQFGVSVPGYSSKGGAIVNNGGTLVVQSSRFEQNYVLTTVPGMAEAFGGCIYTSNSGETRVLDTVFDRNYAAFIRTSYAEGAGKGGAIYHASGLLELSNASFSQNYARSTNGGGYLSKDLSLGGALYLSGGKATIGGSSFDGNEAPSGSNIFMGSEAELTCLDTDPGKEILKDAPTCQVKQVQHRPSTMGRIFHGLMEAGALCALIIVAIATILFCLRRISLFAAKERGEYMEVQDAGAELRTIATPSPTPSAGRKYSEDEPSVYSTLLELLRRSKYHSSEPITIATI